jgi:glucosamine kinase
VPYFLGIDGGGTKTRCLIGDESSILGAGSSTSCKVQRVGETCAQDALAAAIHEACVQAGVSPQQIARTCAGVTGAGRPEIAKTMHGLLRNVVGGEVEVIGDIEIAFEDAFGSGAGVLVIAGTGSIAYGRSPEGETVRIGGWGRSVSDEGSGYWIGLEAVKAVLREHDSQSDSALLSALMHVLAAKSFDDFIVRVNSEPEPDYAALFPEIQRLAETGDSLSISILERAGSELADLAQIVIRRLFADAITIKIATYGGVFGASTQLRDSFLRLVRRFFSQAVFSPSALDAARGALCRARKAQFTS